MSMPEIIYISLFVIFILLCADERCPIKKSIWVCTILALCASIVSTFAALYICWSELGALEVDGVQGRYFLPLSVFFLIAISPIQVERGSNNITHRKTEIIKSSTLVLLMSGLNILATVAIYCAHI